MMMAVVVIAVLVVFVVLTVTVVVKMGLSCDIGGSSNDTDGYRCCINK
jgi:preprotein translocase subunit SecG